MEPQEITQAEAADLLASGFETGRYEPLGLFLVGEAGGWRDAYRALGFQDGKQFDPTTRLSGAPERAAIGG